jgi:hypothetical protein
MCGQGGRELRAANQSSRESRPIHREGRLRCKTPSRQRNWTCPRALLVLFAE